MHHLRSVIAVVAILTLPACTDTESPGGGRAAARAEANTAPTGPAGTMPTTGGTPRITFARRIHDFGVIADAQDYYTTFSFTNTGTGTLVISEVKATCGCTVPTLTKTEYAPGESATLKVTFDPSGKAGVQNKTISVISNALSQSVTNLVVRADVRPLVRYNFRLRFGEIKLGQQYTRRVVLSYSDPDLRITDLYSTNPHLGVKLIDVGAPNPAAGGLPYLATIEVTVGSDAPWGLLHRSQVKFTCHGRAAEQFAPATAPYTVMVIGQVFGDVRADPIMLRSSETIGRNQTFKLSVELTRASGAPFSVTDVRIGETTVPGVKPSVVANGPGAYTVYLDGTAPASGGVVNGNVMVSTDVPGEEELSIRFAFYVKKSTTG